MNTVYKKRPAKTIDPKQDKFITKILENLDKVNASDWEKYTDLQGAYPCNLFSGKYYKGFNIVALFLDTIANRFTSARYATFNSISKAGGRLQKGAKGCVIEFFSFIYKDIESGKSYTLDQVKAMTKEQEKKINKIPCLKSYTVFNSEFIENLSELDLDIVDDLPEGVS